MTFLAVSSHTTPTFKTSQKVQMIPMTRRQRNELVEARVDLILADGLTIEAYAIHFETQMHRSVLHKLLHACYLHFAQVGLTPFGVNQEDLLTSFWFSA
jgi:hypothetical protein